MIFRQATHKDIDRILEITDAAREFQRSLGFVQWEDGYPDFHVIERDINNGHGYVLVENQLPICYAALADNDPDYDRLENVWSFEGPYGVIHRIAIASEMRGRHMTDTLFPLIEKEFLRRGINVIRIDTGEQNVVMQRIMKKFGYINRGLCQFSWGQRLAFEKQIDV